MSQKIKVEQIVDLTAIDNVVEDNTPQLGGDLQSNGNDVVFADNDKAIFGANTDLEVYSDGASSYVHSKKAGGYLRLKSEGGIVLQAGNSENVLFASQNGKTALYFDAAEKLETTSTGVAITGTLAATAITGDGSGLTNLPAAGIANVVEDTSPQLGADLQTNGNDIDFADNDKAIFGAGNDLQIYHDPSGAGHSYINETNVIGNLIVQADSLTLKRKDGNAENFIVCQANAAVDLYYDGAKKLETTTTGAKITGAVEATTVDLGAWTVTESSNVLYFAHNGTNKMKIDSSGNLTVVGDVTAFGSV